MADPATASYSWSIFWGQFSGTVIGSFFTLLGIGFTTWLSDSKKEKDKKAEILENFQECASTYIECIFLMRNAENLSGYFGQLLLCPQVPENLHGYHKEESQKWMEEVRTTNKNLIEAKTNFYRLYMSFKIHFGKDDAFRELINDLLRKAEFKLQQYANVFDANELTRIEKENAQEIQKVFVTVFHPKKDKLLAFLDRVVPQTKSFSFKNFCKKKPAPTPGLDSIEAEKPRPGSPTSPT